MSQDPNIYWDRPKNEILWRSFVHEISFFRSFLLIKIFWKFYILNSFLLKIFKKFLGKLFLRLRSQKDFQTYSQCRVHDQISWTRHWDLIWEYSYEISWDLLQLENFLMNKINFLTWTRVQVRNVCLKCHFQLDKWTRVQWGIFRIFLIKMKIFRFL